MTPPGARARAGSIVGLALVGYGISQWHRMATWGADEREVAARMPGDDIVGHARYCSTHAVTINAPAADVWPWLVQMGQGRGGLYSYDRLENLLRLDIHSAQEIDADLQDLSVGDVIRLVPEDNQPPLRFVVAQLTPPSTLVLGPAGTRSDAFTAGLPYPSWTFQLTPAGADTCRLVVRFRADFVPTVAGLLAYKYALQPVHCVMERKMMLGIKQRAEAAAGLPARRVPVPA